MIDENYPTYDRDPAVFWCGESSYACISDEDLAYLSRPKPERCVSCGCFNHHALCVSLCDDWAVKMPFGKHKGERIEKVPRDYLQWLRRTAFRLDPEVKQGIDRVLELEAAA